MSVASSPDISPDISIIAPMYNEAGNVAPLYEEIRAAFDPLGRAYEIIFVNDGSTDATLEEMRALLPQGRLTIIEFDRNYGQTAAQDAGMRQARGALIATLDGDRQNDPADLPRMVATLETDGVDMVSGRRVKREDPGVKLYSSWIANLFRIYMTGDTNWDNGCCMRVFRAECLHDIKLYRNMHRFMVTLFKMEGFTVTEVPVAHRPRTAGVSKYGVANRLFNSIRMLFAVRWMQANHFRYRIKDVIHE